jgi:outer membrane protein insertion porin family
MFRQNGLGPKDGGRLGFVPSDDPPSLTMGVVDSLGGELFWSAGVSLISDILRRPSWPVKTHVFLNAGRLDLLDKCSFFHCLFLPFPLDCSECWLTLLLTAKPLGTTLQDMFSKPSISAGLGLIYRFDPIRLEVNLGVPLVASKTDTLRRGIQVGIGMEFS